MKSSRMPVLPVAQLLIFVFVWAMALPASLSANLSANHAVILTYHHVSHDTPPSTSVTPAQFDAHLDFIATHGYHVWPLNKLLKKLRSGTQVPDNVVVLTFDDAYQSVFSQVRPRMRGLGWPYTVFVNTGAIDRNRAPYMSWEQLRQLADEGVEIGNHSQNHEHMVRRPANETLPAWRERNRGDIERAQQRLQRELGVAATLFAYPYGEYTSALSREITSMGFTGLGQHSGAVGFDSNFEALPRFPISGRYAGLEQLATRLNAEPLLIQAEPAGPAIFIDKNSDVGLSLEIAEGPYDPATIACYATGQGRMRLTRSASDPWRVSIRPMQPLAPGRSKFNCTIPHKHKAGAYFWWSYLLMKPHADGTWYNN